MTRKIFRKLFIVFAALFLFLTNVPANADEACEQACLQDYGECMADVYLCPAWCGGDPYCAQQCFELGIPGCWMNYQNCLDYYCE
jgi:hypothetical protein